MDVERPGPGGLSAQGRVPPLAVSSWRRGESLAEPAVGSLEPELAFHPSLPILATYDDLNTALRIWKIDAGLTKGPHHMIPIQFFSANPTDVALKLAEEVRDIQANLERAKMRDRFRFEIHMALRPSDLQHFLRVGQPRIVQFSGHGTRGGSLLMQNGADKPVKIGTEALSAVFRIASKHVECVVLNACYAEIQARAIARHVRFVVGMSNAISDGAAIAYSSGFYQALGDGAGIEEAHESGKAEILLAKLKEADTPVLIRPRLERATERREPGSTVRRGEVERWR